MQGGFKPTEPKQQGYTHCPKQQDYTHCPQAAGLHPPLPSSRVTPTAAKL